MVIHERQISGAGQATGTAPCVNVCWNALTEAQMVGKTSALCRKSSPFRTLLNDCQKCNTQNNTFLSSTLLSDFAPYLDYCASLQNSDENEPDENEPDENEPDENEDGSSNSKPSSTSRPGETTFSGNEVIFGTPKLAPKPTTTLIPTPTSGPTGRDSPCYNDCSAALGTAIDIGQVSQLCIQNGDFSQKLNRCSGSCKNNNDALFLIGGLLNKMQPYASYCKWDVNIVLSPGTNDITNGGKNGAPNATATRLPEQQTQTAEPTSRSDSAGGGSKAWIAGAVLGPLLLVLLICGVVFLLLRKRKQKLQSWKNSIAERNSDSLSEKDGENCISEMPERDHPIELEGDSPTVGELGVNEQLDVPRQTGGGEKTTYG